MNYAKNLTTARGTNVLPVTDQKLILIVMQNISKGKELRLFFSSLTNLFPLFKITICAK